MSRSTLALDRIATLVVGLVLLAAGGAALLWWFDLVSWFPRLLDLSAVKDAIGQPWWPWAWGAAGVVLVLLGLWWAAAHIPDRGVGELKLPGSSADGKLRAASTPVAQAAAAALQGANGVRTVRGRIVRERGQLVARLSATIEAGADLHAVAAAADQVATELAAVLDRDDVHCQVRLKVASRTRSLPRVT